MINNRPPFKKSFYFLNFIGRSTVLFFFLYPIVLPKNRNLLVNSDSDIVIEGFPRSANSFSVFALKYTHSNDLKIAHHTHVPAQVIKGVSLRIPILILIRHPRDAIASLVLRDPNISISQAINSYVHFYQAIYNYKESFIVANFEEIINNYSSVITRINNKFKTNLGSITPKGRDLEKIFELIESFETVENKRSRPSEHKNKLKKQIIEEIECSKYKEDMLIAVKIYHTYLSLSKLDNL